MAHPNGGRGERFNRIHTFDQAYVAVGVNGIRCNSTTGRQIEVSQTIAGDGITPTITFREENGRPNNVCAACWDFRLNCNGRTGTRIGHYVVGLDEHLTP
jgi:hypothetical protein